MIFIEDIYKANQLMDYGQFKNAAIIRNAKKIEDGESPADELFRCTGRSTFLCAAAISLTSFGKTVVIYAENISQARRLRKRISGLAYNLTVPADFILQLHTSIIITTKRQESFDLHSRSWDIVLTDSDEKDIRMRKTRFYK